eukprot:6035989-Amphidinium_carterae.1
MLVKPLSIMQIMSWKLAFCCTSLYRNGPSCFPHTLLTNTALQADAHLPGCWLEVACARSI